MAEILPMVAPAMKMLESIPAVPGALAVMSPMDPAAVILEFKIQVVSAIVFRYPCRVAHACPAHVGCR